MSHQEQGRPLRQETPSARIAVMLPRFSRYGGVEQYGYALAETLARRGYAVDFLCARQETEAPPGVRVLAVGRPPGPKTLKMLWFLIRVERLRRAGAYDLSISLGRTWQQDIARIGGGPLQTFWRLSREAWAPGLPRRSKHLSRLLRPSNWLTLLLERRMFTRTPRLVAISDTLRRWIQEVYPHLAQSGEAQELLTIYNCPDLARFRAPAAEERLAARTALGVGRDQYALGVATTNFALKGVASLIRALPLLAADTHLHVAGGRKAASYRALAAALGVAERVHFHGRIADMPSFYHSLDMFILPSFYDTLGNVVLEALSCGLKTLCSNRAGASAFLPPEQVISDPGDAGEIADKARRLRRAEGIAPFAPKGSGLDEFIALAEELLKKKGGTAASSTASLSLLAGGARP